MLGSTLCSDQRTDRLLEVRKVDLQAILPP